MKSAYFSPHASALFALLLTVQCLSAQTDATTLVESINSEMAFPRRIVGVGKQAPGVAESQELWDALNTLREGGVTAGIDALEAYVARRPNSAWTASVRANLASFYERKGRHSQALSHWLGASEATKEDSSDHGMKVADVVLAECVPLLNKLGRTEELEAIGKQTRGRKFVLSAAQAKVSTILGAAPWSGDAYRCGTFALYEVLKSLKADADDLRQILELPAPGRGFSFADLVRIASEHNVGLAAVARGDTDELPVPSVVHWRLNHYGAIVERRGDAYKVIDPVFSAARWMDAESVYAESSGYF